MHNIKYCVTVVIHFEESVINNAYVMKNKRNISFLKGYVVYQHRLIVNRKQINDIYLVGVIGLWF